jgi:succinate dehydrogenase/fumarate reductase flavoprotein subunit
MAEGAGLGARGVGAVVDRTKEGKVSQRNFGGHEYPHPTSGPLAP